MVATMRTEVDSVKAGVEGSGGSQKNRLGPGTHNGGSGEAEKRKS